MRAVLSRSNAAMFRHTCHVLCGGAIECVCTCVLLCLCTCVHVYVCAVLAHMLVIYACGAELLTLCIIVGVFTT